jgi:hypothetical protein
LIFFFTKPFIFIFIISKKSSQNLDWYHPPSLAGSSVPNSPLIKSKNRQSRTPLNSTPTTPHHSLLPSKKLKTVSESTRPSIFQRLFGLRSSINPQQQSIPPIVIEPSPLISPLTVTLDSHDDLMPLTTSSTTSSGSGRASSSGYESMSNTQFEEMIASIPAMMVTETNSIKLRNKTMRKGLNYIHHIFIPHSTRRSLENLEKYAIETKDSISA